MNITAVPNNYFWIDFEPMWFKIAQLAMLAEKISQRSEDALTAPWQLSDEKNEIYYKLCNDFDLEGCCP